MQRDKCTWLLGWSLAGTAGAVLLMSLLAGVMVSIGPTAQATIENGSPISAPREEVFAHSDGMVSPGQTLPDLAQVTVRPDAPKRVFEEKEDRPWTLLMGKAMLPATLALGAFVVIWYVMKLTRTRYRRS